MTPLSKPARLSERIGGVFRRSVFRASHRLLPWLSQPLGHFYSPVGHPADLTARRDALWPAHPVTPGLEFNPPDQSRLLRDVFPPLLRDFDYPLDADHAHRFHLGNSQFSHADARALFALLRHWRPRRLIEIGSGNTTLLIADVNARFLGNSMEVSAIEPFPRPFLQTLAGLRALRAEAVQSTPDEVFETLEAGDVLFIDSSHVLKTGSDLTHLMTRILPGLRSGVRIHFHDVFLPDDYPPDWVLRLNRSWNEQYVLHAILANGSRYRVLYGTQYALTRLSTDARSAFGAMAGQPYAGGSFWIEVR